MASENLQAVPVETKEYHDESQSGENCTTAQVSTKLEKLFVSGETTANTKINVEKDSGDYDISANLVAENLEQESLKISEPSDDVECKSNLTTTSTEVYVYEELKQSKIQDASRIVQPLLLGSPSSDESEKHAAGEIINNIVLSPSKSKMSDLATPCVICDYIEPDVDIKSGRDEYLCHLIVEHGLVVADVKLIADLRSYAIYWKKRFDEGSLEDFCSKIRTNTGAKDIEKSEEYYLLCDHLPEDKKIREDLQLNKLKKLLLRQEFERKDENFTRLCPFCKKMFQGNRIMLFNHMTEDHNFNIGHPDNIVNVREFLDEIQFKLDMLQCLFCEKVFKDKTSLREHMRKKAHRRLNPKNKDYDKYYIINYLELGKNWEALQGESEKLDSAAETLVLFDPTCGKIQRQIMLLTVDTPSKTTSCDWSGWNEESQHAVCFFCDDSYDQAEKIYSHMKEQHDFDFITIRKEMQLSFYQQIKLINYIRREVYVDKRQTDDVVSTIKESLTSSTKWNQPQYYFSTYEDDSLLCQLEDRDDLYEPEDTFVIGEDGIDCRSIVNDSVLTDLVVGGYFDV